MVVVVVVVVVVERVWGGVRRGGDMEVMSGWARQPLPQLIALLRIMTHPQPIAAHGHLHLHLLIFHVVRWVFTMRTHTHTNIC